MAERKNKHIVECSRALFIESQVPRTFWCEAVRTAIYLINRLPVKLLDQISPYQILFGSTPHPPT